MKDIESPFKGVTPDKVAEEAWSNHIITQAEEIVKPAWEARVLTVKELEELAREVFRGVETNPGVGALDCYCSTYLDRQPITEDYITQTEQGARREIIPVQEKVDLTANWEDAEDLAEDSSVRSISFGRYPTIQGQRDQMRMRIEANVPDIGIMRKTIVFGLEGSWKEVGRSDERHGLNNQDILLASRILNNMRKILD